MIKTVLVFPQRQKKREELLETFKVNDLIGIVTTEKEDLIFKLNNRTFKILFGYKILNPCQITNIQKEENGQTSLEFHYSKPTYPLLLSDKPMVEAFPDMKPLKTIKIS